METMPGSCDGDMTGVLAPLLPTFLSPPSVGVPLGVCLLSGSCGPPPPPPGDALDWRDCCPLDARSLSSGLAVRLGLLSGLMLPALPTLCARLWSMGLGGTPVRAALTRRGGGMGLPDDAGCSAPVVVPAPLPLVGVAPRRPAAGLWLASLRWSTGLGAVLVATVRCSVLGLPGKGRQGRAMQNRGNRRVSRLTFVYFLFGYNAFWPIWPLSGP